MAEQQPGFFDQRNPKTDEPAEQVLSLGPRTVITVDGVRYKVTRGGELHVNALPAEEQEQEVKTRGIVPEDGSE